MFNLTSKNLFFLVGGSWKIFWNIFGTNQLWKFWLGGSVAKMSWGGYEYLIKMMKRKIIFRYE